VKKRGAGCRDAHVGDIADEEGEGVGQVEALVEDNLVRRSVNAGNGQRCEGGAACR
jgi:hypothetical protein